MGEVAVAGRRMPALVWLVVFIACLVAFAGISDVAGRPGIPPVDTSTTTLLHDLASPSLDAIMSGVTGLGSTLVLVVIAGLASVTLAAGRRGATALFMAVALGGSLVLNDVLKLHFQRPRPALDWAEVRPEYAFPSGHAMNSLVVYVALALIAWQLWGRGAGIAAIALSLVVTIAIGASRVYLGVHWLTDVVGGFLAGVMWLLIVVAVFGRRRLGPRDAGSPSTVAPDRPASEVRS